MLSDMPGFDFSLFCGGDLFRQVAKQRNCTMEELLRQAQDDVTVDNEVDSKAQVMRGKYPHLIYESRLGWYFIPTSLKVLLVCSVETRIQRIKHRMEECGKTVTLEYVADTTHDRDNNDAKRYQQRYGIQNTQDPTRYDLVLNTKTYDVNQCVAIIVAVMQLPERPLVRKHGTGPLV
jgi:cytidylate kinase